MIRGASTRALFHGVVTPPAARPTRLENSQLWWFILSNTVVSVQKGQGPGGEEASNIVDLSQYFPPRLVVSTKLRLGPVG